MKKSELDEQLVATQQMKLRSWGKIISILKRQFDAWASEEFFKSGHEHMKMWYMPLIMNIGPDGITNNELAKKAFMTKQAMSKIVKELLQLGYIETQTDSVDKRCSNIFLTDKGKKFAIESRIKICGMEDEYEKLLGKQKFEEVKDILLEIIDHNNEKYPMKPM